jgi:hypothetical protein
MPNVRTWREVRKRGGASLDPKIGKTELPDIINSLF